MEIGRFFVLRPLWELRGNVWWSS